MWSKLQLHKFGFQHSSLKGKVLGRTTRNEVAPARINYCWVCIFCSICGLCCALPNQYSNLPVFPWSIVGPNMIFLDLRASLIFGFYASFKQFGPQKEQLKQYSTFTKPVPQLLRINCSLLLQSLTSGIRHLQSTLSMTGRFKVHWAWLEGSKSSWFTTVSW